MGRASRSSANSIRLATAAVAAACVLLLVPASASAADLTRSYAPVKEGANTVVFRVKGINPDQVASASARFKRRGGAGWIRRRVEARKIRHAARQDGLVRLRKPGKGGKSHLQVALEPAPTTEPAPEPGPDPAPAPSPASCALDAGTLTAPGCELVNSDTAAAQNPEPLWGNIECAADSRHSWQQVGGDTHPSATGAAPSEDAFRRLTVLDGDDYYGERCELGRNEHRFGEGNEQGTFAVYREGQRRLTFVSMRFTDSLPLTTSRWQTVVQMKQAQPSAGGGGGPILEVQAYNGRLQLIHAWDVIWSTPVQGGSWTRMVFDVTYSRDPAQGRITMYADTNGDGDASDSGEQSPTFSTSTLKTEISGGWEHDGLAPGDSIPSHLRTGVYHDPQIGCSAGCAVDVDNVQVVKPS